MPAYRELEGQYVVSGASGSQNTVMLCCRLARIAVSSKSKFEFLRTKPNFPPHFRPFVQFDTKLLSATSTLCCLFSLLYLLLILLL